MLYKKDYVWREITGRPSRNVGYWMARGYEAGKKDVCEERLLAGWRRKGTCRQTLAEKAKRSFAMQSRLQAWRGVFAGREAPHIYLPAASHVLLPADFCQKKIAKNIPFL